MGLYLECPDYDRDIRKLSVEPLVINEIDTNEWENVDVIKEYMITRCDSDVIEILPQCDCGMTTGRYNAATLKTKATVCRHCKTPVVSPIERPFESTVWISAPEGVTALMRPNFLQMFRKTFKMDGIPIIDWFCDTSKKIGNEYNDIYLRLKELGFPRGYNNFIENFDAIFSALTQPGMIKGNAQARNEMVEFVAQNRNILFTQVLPMPSRRSIITEQSDATMFVVGGYAHVINAARQLVELKSGYDIKQRRKEVVTYRSLIELSEYTKFVDSKILCKKEGWWRKQVFGSRAGPSYRGVVSGFMGESDSIKLPWRMAVGAYSCVLVGELIRMGEGNNDAERRITEAMCRFDPVINEIFKKLIRESFATTVRGTPGLAQILGRNPTLDDHSIQAFVCVEIKTDLRDNTISIPYDVLVAPNCDFDGKLVAIVW